MGTSRPLQQIDRTFVDLDGTKLSYFSGCDYFRLASDPRMVSAAKTALEKFGLNVAASRGTTGNHLLYEELEAAIAGFFGVPRATLVSSGYLAASAVLQALSGEFTHAFIDEQAHACLFDAARFLDCPLTCFEHRNPDALRSAVQQVRRNKRVLILTDGMFSRDGSVAPLRDYLRVIPRSARLLVDDSHGAGVLGPTGRGTLEHEQVAGSRILQTLTLSKAFGSFGGVILGNAKLQRTILSRSRCFAASTPAPLPSVAAALEGVRLLGSDSSRLARLRSNHHIVRESLPNLAMQPGPIIALPPLSRPATRNLQQALLSAGIYPPLLRYHSGPPYFRFVLSSEHTPEQMQSLVGCLQRHF